MNALIEALPEILIVLIAFGVIYLLARKKLAKERRTEMVVVFVAGGAIAIILLIQSGSPTLRTLQVEEQFASPNAPLAELKDASPDTLTAEESSARLEKLIAEQRENTTLSSDKKDDDKGQ